MTKSENIFKRNKQYGAPNHTEFKKTIKSHLNRDPQTKTNLLISVADL